MDNMNAASNASIESKMLKSSCDMILKYTKKIPVNPINEQRPQINNRNVSGHSS